MLRQHFEVGSWNEPDEKAIINNQLAACETIDNIASLVGRLRAYRFVERKANQLLEQHPHFHGRGEHVTCKCSKNQLVLQGKVPSFYLKQLAQEALRGLADVIRIDNQITVASPTGEITENNLKTVVRRPNFGKNKPK